MNSENINFFCLSLFCLFIKSDISKPSRMSQVLMNRFEHVCSSDDEEGQQGESAYSVAVDSLI